MLVSLSADKHAGREAATLLANLRKSISSDQGGVVVFNEIARAEAVASKRRKSASAEARKAFKGWKK